MIDPEERMMKEMAAIQERIQHKTRKKEKKKREMKKQARKRMAQFKQSEGMVEETINDPDLFSLDIFDKKSDLEAHALTACDPHGADLDSGSEEEMDKESENAEMQYEAMMEDYLERSYQRYLHRKGDDADLEDATVKRRKRLDQAGELSDEVEEVENVTEMEADETERKPGGGLLVELDASKAGVATTPEAITAQWFNQEIFQDDDLMEERDQTPAAGLVEQDAMREEIEEVKDQPPQEEDSGFEVVKQTQPADPTSGKSIERPILSIRC